MGTCTSTTNVRQAAVHPENNAINNTNNTNNNTTNGRPPPHNNQPVEVDVLNHRTNHTSAGSYRRRKPPPAATPLRRQKVPQIDYTPIVKAEKDKYKFSCPLCFCYFADTILTTSCCSNYTCYTCALEHSKTHGLYKKSKQLPERLQNVPCPHCNTANVQLKYVAAGDQVRSYDTSPATQARLNGDLNRKLSTELKEETPEHDSSDEEDNNHSQVIVESC
jgi:hypothetical protein